MVVDAKYGSLWGGWCSTIGRGPYGVSLWKAIMNEWDKFSLHCSFVVGDGRKVMFWQDLCKWGVCRSFVVALLDSLGAVVFGVQHVWGELGAAGPCVYGLLGRVILAGINRWSFGGLSLIV
uniref:Reverse transcriptase zinc-binding domain-containing protein n=1 Tax=Fagus sylvatica TaxID=28930 RepID=A0A2N9IUQ9_FAGSY